MDITSKVAMNSTCRSKHGAAIWKAGSLLSIGINKSRLMNEYKTWWEDGPVPSEHAEMSAIRQCGDADLNGAVLYVSRVNNTGEEMFSRPCSNCSDAISSRGIKTVIYTV
ncbi:CMP deaminase [Rhodococcus phage Grayson]|nr:CMP deaminase [Rhodococcus phage Grayson]